MNKIKRSGKLLQAVFTVLLREKKLLLFPLIASVLALVLAIFFIAPIALQPTGYSYTSGKHWTAVIQSFAPETQAEVKSDPVKHTPYRPPLQHAAWWVAPFLAITYFVSMFLATFSNVAFYHEIMQALDGNTVSIQRGFRFAATKWRPILMWSLFAGLVGYIINAIEQRFSFFGRIIAGFLGFAWSVACIFVIPTLVRDTENANPLKLLRTSAGTLKRSWGELVIGFVGLELALGLVFMLLLLLAIVGAGMGGVYLGLHFNLQSLGMVAVCIGAMMLVAMPFLLFC